MQAEQIIILVTPIFFALIGLEYWVGKRRGGYVEGVYRLNRTWDVGYGYDKLWADDSGPLAGAPFNSTPPLM